MNLVVFLSHFIRTLILLSDTLLANNAHLTLAKTKDQTQPLLTISSVIKTVQPVLHLKYSAIFLVLFLPSLSWATELTEIVSPAKSIDLTQHWAGYLALIVFAVAYILAMTEEVTELKKSKPMVFAASLIWIFIAAVYASDGMSEQAGVAFRISLESYAELFLFIMVSMTYLNAMEDRGVFDSLRIWLLSKNFTYRQLFWITGFQSFFISAGCNNLTTALLMGSVILAMGKDNPRFVTLSCINVVVASNAGGSFSPFGDITTLLVWQKGVVPFTDFFSLLIPAIINFVIPAGIMHFFIPKERPAAVMEAQTMQRGGWVIIFLFILTIITSACFENFLSLPPAAGMMLGLTYLKFFSYYLQKTRESHSTLIPVDLTDVKIDYFAPMKYMNNPQAETDQQLEKELPFDIFQKVANLEWDTLLFFYGVMVGVGGLSFIGYLGMASHHLYGSIDPTVANILVGIASAFVDNGTIMLSVLTMAPDISQGQWLLVTLTAGVGGSLLAVGSAAGVGLMGQAKGIYTFTSHLKWTPAIALGYAGSIAAHFLINGRYF
ncbi:sodium:proton antiporter NhaD [Methylobacter sp. S3L5C]|uniref:sodium:proton antiporter NhaD n=1 Tax=Methylobacter sp. S3L5C TaxID=2839024 RepID=UPI001FAC4429|nr:sodium:proton antiporter NhaD [Methylobacter sp. S3L5C]